MNFVISDNPLSLSGTFAKDKFQKISYPLTAKVTTTKFFRQQDNLLKETLEMDTNPGYALSSPSFSVKFVCAQQKKTVSYLLEYETDWKEVQY